MPKIDEAMALAAMNPMIGMSGPHHASFIVNVMNHDKDLGDDGKVLTGVSKSLDMDDNLYGIDQNGRFFAKRKYDVMERKDIIECYKVNKDCTALIEEIEKEIQIPYDIRPIHKPSYIYEALTGHALLDENQMEYDSLCEKVQLDKMTAALAGVTQGSLQRAHNMQTGKQDKEAGYIPDYDFPQGTENMSVPGMALESSEMKDDEYLACCKSFTDTFAELFPTYAAHHPKTGGVYNMNKGYPYITYMKVEGIRCPKRVLDGYESMLKSIYNKLKEQGYSVIYDGADNGGRSIKYETKEIVTKEYEPTPSSIQSKVDDCNIVCQSLDDKEHDIAVDNIENKNILFIKVEYDKDKPIGFIICKKPGGKDINKLVKECYTILVVNKEYRGRGIATSLVKALIQWFKRSDYEQLIWACHIINKASNALAQKCGFTYGWKKDNGKSNVYLITNPNKLKAIRETNQPKFTTRVENKGNTNKVSLHYSSPNEDWKRKHQVKDTKNGHEEITVEKWEQNGQDLKNLREVANTKFYVEGETMYTLDENIVGDIFYKGIRTVNDFTFKHQPYTVYCITSASEAPNRPFCASLKQATFDYLRTIYPKYKNMNSIMVDKIRISKKWFESNKNRNIILWMATFEDKKSENKIYLPNEYQKMANLSLEDLFRTHSLDLVLESVTLEDGLFRSMGILNEAKLETNTLIPFKCEIKYCHQWIDNGVPKPIKGNPAPMLILHKDNKNWRVRTELLLFKDDKVFLCKQDTINQYGNKYKIPGGGIDDPKESIELRAAKECEEEARIIPKNVKYTGVCIQKVYEKTPGWHSLILHPEGIKYDGSISFVCTGVYNKDYKGFIKKMDQDETKNGHFYSWNEVKDLLSKEHKKIFREYLESIGKPANFNEAVESDAIFNTDQRFLYKFKNIENLVSYIQNDIKPCEKEEDIRFIWPVELIQKKKGSCMDVAVLVHYYCELNNIENLIARIGITYKNSPNVKTESSYSHIVAMYKKNNKWSIVNNVGPDRLSKNLFTGNNNANDTLELFAKTFLPCLINHLKESKPNMIVTGEIKDIANKESSEKFDSEFFNKSGLNKQNTIRGLFESVFNAFSLEDGMLALLGVKN